MIIDINYNESDAVHLQIRNQIMMGIISSRFKVKEVFPPAYELADYMGITLETVSRAYGLLRQEGFVTTDPRRGTRVANIFDTTGAHDEVKNDLVMVMAKAKCKNISREEVHNLIDRIYEKYDELK